MVISIAFCIPEGNYSMGISGSSNGIPVSDIINHSYGSYVSLFTIFHGRSPSCGESSRESTGNIQLFTLDGPLSLIF